MGILQGKVILVTGAGRSVGRDIAILAAAEGAKVVVIDVGVETDGSGGDAGPAHEVVKAIESAGGNAVANLQSVADWDAAHAMVQQALDTYGRIDGIVNNAGILRDVIFHKMTPSEFNDVIDVHLRGSFNVARAAAAHFRAQGGGSMVHMTSTSGLIGSMGQANYAAAKLGLAGLSRSIAIDMANFNVTSNCIAPFAFSRMVDAIPIRNDTDARKVAQARKMESRKIAPLVVALLSDRASKITGQIFSVRANEMFLFSQPRPIRSTHRDGGWTPQTILDHALPALKSDFFGLERTADIISWDPI